MNYVIARTVDIFELILAMILMILLGLGRTFVRLTSALFFFRIFISDEREEKVAAKEDPDFDRSCDELIRSKGFDVETFHVRTEDGYFLTLFRIPRARGEKHSHHVTHKPVVFILHGFMQNSEVWVCRKNVEDNLPLVLADRGYDVWLGNVRGNKYCSKHVTYTTAEPEFWKFSLDQLIHCDIPTMLNFVLRTTEMPSLSYVGFSQGTAVGFGAFSFDPELAKKIDVFIALASTAKVKPLKNTLVQTIIHSRPDLVFLIFGRMQFLDVSLWWRSFTSRNLFSAAIELSNNMLFGWTAQEIAYDEKPMVYAHLYSTTSVQSVVHWFQIICTGEFQMFDSSLPTSATSTYYSNPIPKYELHRITCPTACFYGGRDNLPDIERLLEELPEDTQSHCIEPYEHLDFLWAESAKDILYPRICNLLDRYSVKEEVQLEGEAVVDGDDMIEM